MEYELNVAAHELASELGGVDEEQLDVIKTALVEAFKAGEEGKQLI